MICVNPLKFYVRMFASVIKYLLLFSMNDCFPFNGMRESCAIKLIN